LQCSGYFLLIQAFNPASIVASRVSFEALAVPTLHEILYQLTKIPGDREIDSVLFSGDCKS
jgi:hypothetical protein